MESSFVQPVEATRLLEHLTALEGERHPSFSRARLAAAETYVRDQWRSWHFTISMDELSYMGASFVNLIARPPAFPPGPRLIIGAHLDTVPGTPGADDNASGVAVMLEASRIIAHTSPALPVEFVAFTLEELGMVGSDHYAAAMQRQGHEVLGMLSLEMVGFTESEGLQHYPWFLRGRYPPIGNYLALAANRRSTKLLETAATACRSVPGLPVETMVIPQNGWLLPESRLSDHAPFWDRGYPALLVTDTAFFRNPHYHQPSDTVETLDMSFLQHVTQGLVAMIHAIAITN